MHYNALGFNLVKMLSMLRESAVCIGTLSAMERMT